jgi:hypothetical protein
VPAWAEGFVWLWPEVAQLQRQLPLRVRLIRIRGQKGRDVWLSLPATLPRPCVGGSSLPQVSRRPP